MLERGARALLALWQAKGVGSDAFDAIIARDEAAAVVDAITPDEYEQVGEKMAFVNGRWQPVYVKRTPPAAPPEPLVPEKEVCPHRVVDPGFGCVRCGETAWIGPPVAPEPIPTVSPFNPEGITMDEAGNLIYPAPEPEGTCPECNGTGGGPVRVAGDEWELQECGACGGVRVVPASPTKENEG